MESFRDFVGSNVVYLSTGIAGVLELILFVKRRSSYKPRLNAHARWVIFSREMCTEVLGVTGIKLRMVEMFGKPKARKMTHTVGVGRHSDTEVNEMMKNDVRHFATLLGDKPYLMGDKMSLVDCSAFGILSQVRWGTPVVCPGQQLLIQQRNIVDYMDRIKQTYWPDWEDLKCDKSPF